MFDRLDYLVNIAKSDENIRGVVLYGSRANEEIPPDQYQDYDVIFIADQKDRFDISIIEGVKVDFVPSDVYPDMFKDARTYLMLFEDDSRVDLTICTMEAFLLDHSDGQPLKCLLDKDNKLQIHIKVDPEINWVKPMDEPTYDNTCSEFFWEIQNVVKGLKRDELSFAMFIRDISLRDMLNRMIDTYIGINYEYKVSVGTLGKYRKQYLPSSLYEIYRSTYLSNTVEDIWKSLYYMIDLFGITGKYIANENGFHYPGEKEQYIREYTDRIMKL